MSSSLGDTTGIELSRFADSSYCSISNYITAWKEYTWAVPPIIGPNPSEVIRRLPKFRFTHTIRMFQDMSNRYSVEASDELTASDTVADVLSHSHKICRPAKG
jgi:hypothetical protein